MFSFNFFSPTGKKSFAKNLTEVIITNESEPLIKATLDRDISRPSSLTPIRELPKALISDEIQACIEMLAAAKNEFLAYPALQAKRRTILGLFNLLCLLTIPSLSFTLMYKLHYAIALHLAKQINHLQPFLDRAWNELSSFKDNYAAKLAPLNEELERTTHPHVPCVNSLITHDEGLALTDKIMDYFLKCMIWPFPVIERPYWEPDMGNPADFCQLAEREYTDSKCKEWADTLCEFEAKLVNCTDTLYAKHHDAELSLEAFEEKNIATLQKLQKHHDSINEQINNLQSQSTWEPISGGVFLFLLCSCSSLLVYLITSWRKAEVEYKTNVERKHSLQECLTDPIHLNRITNLVNFLWLDGTFTVSMQNIMLEDLINLLRERKKEYQTATVKHLFFKELTLHKKFPNEIANMIIDKMNPQQDLPIINELPIFYPRLK